MANDRRYFVRHPDLGVAHGAHERIVDVRLQPGDEPRCRFREPLLYSVASNPAEYKASFNDITAGNNDIYGLDDGLVYPATPGYDLASGLGSPRLTGPGGTAGLAYYLCQSARSPRRPVVSGLSPASGTTAGGEQVTITGTGFETGGKPAVATIEVGTAQLPPADFTVHSATSITAALPPASRPRPPDAPAPQDGAGGADVIVTLADGQTSAPGPQASFEYVDTERFELRSQHYGCRPHRQDESRLRRR